MQIFHIYSFVKYLANFLRLVCHVMPLWVFFTCSWFLCLCSFQSYVERNDLNVFFNYCRLSSVCLLWWFIWHILLIILLVLFKDTFESISVAGKSFHSLLTTDQHICLIKLFFALLCCHHSCISQSILSKLKFRSCSIFMVKMQTENVLPLCGRSHYLVIKFNFPLIGYGLYNGSYDLGPGSLVILENHFYYSCWSWRLTLYLII